MRHLAIGAAVFLNVLLSDGICNDEATNYYKCLWVYKGGHDFQPRVAVNSHGQSYITDARGTLLEIDSNGYVTWQWASIAEQPSGVWVSSCTPRLLNDTDVLMAASGGLHCIQVHRGERWNIPVKEYLAGIAVDHDSNIVMVSDGEIRKLNQDGKLLWKDQGAFSTFSNPVITDNGAIYVADTSCQITVYSGDGHKIGALHTEVWCQTSISFNAEGYGYCGDMFGNIYCFTPDFQLRWQRKLTGTFPTMPLVTKDGLVGVGCLEGVVSLLSAVDGRVIREYNCGAPVTSPLCDDTTGRIYALTVKGDLYCISKDKSVKKYEGFGGDIHSILQLWDGKLVFHVHEKTLRCYELEVGKSGNAGQAEKSDSAAPSSSTP